VSNSIRKRYIPVAETRQNYIKKKITEEVSSVEEFDRILSRRLEPSGA
jgi:hypothetical protein